ncbi:MAG TPA: cell division protein ZapA [Ignavibacteria bacterium]|nr:cell division protein ZapA [Ignavibacteria bacterium]
MQNSGIKVRIFNSEYNLQGENVAEVERLANYVDTLMQKINFESPNQSIETIAVVTSLNIAETMFKEKDAIKKSEHELLSHFDKCSDKIDEISRLIDDNI